MAVKNSVLSFRLRLGSTFALAGWWGVPDADFKDTLLTDLVQLSEVGHEFASFVSGLDILVPLLFCL